MGLLIDSTAFIAAERNRQTVAEFIADIIDRWGDVELSLSVMSAAELMHGVWRADSAARRARRQEFVESVLLAIPVLPVTLTIARVFAQLDADLSARGRRIPTSDLLIASTALAGGDEVVTGNPRHFDRVRGLKVRAIG